jgi:hypothetical protein
MLPLPTSLIYCLHLSRYNLARLRFQTCICCQQLRSEMRSFRELTSWLLPTGFGSFEMVAPHGLWLL